MNPAMSEWCALWKDVRRIDDVSPGPFSVSKRLGAALHPAIERHHPQLARRLVSMLLVLDGAVLLTRLESEQHLAQKADEALYLLELILSGQLTHHGP